MPDQPRLLPPSPGILTAVRKLLEARPETTKEAHAILKRIWPRVDYATADLAFAHYLDASTMADAPASTAAVTVTPIGGGRVLGVTEGTKVD